MGRKNGQSHEFESIVLIPMSHPPLAPAAAVAYGADDARVDFDEVYEKYFDFVWRSVRRLGAVESSIDDVTQEIFVIVLRRLPEFETRSSFRTWLFGIALGVVRNHRRMARRKYPHALSAEAYADADALVEIEAKGPEAMTQTGEQVRLLYQLLDQLDDDKREVFVMTELEQLTVAEAAELLGLNANTAASRLRFARQEFNKAVERYRMQHERRSPAKRQEKVR
jgi:RNA polymerase sigma-70 factor (ECF subfamily)